MYIYMYISIYINIYLACMCMQAAVILTHVVPLTTYTFSYLSKILFSSMVKIQLPKTLTQSIFSGFFAAQVFQVQAPCLILRVSFLCRTGGFSCNSTDPRLGFLSIRSLLLFLVEYILSHINCILQTWKNALNIIS